MVVAAPIPWEAIPPTTEAQAQRHDCREYAAIARKLCWRSADITIEKVITHPPHGGRQPRRSLDARTNYGR